MAYKQQATGPVFRMLSDEKIQRIQDGALHLLQNVGVSFEGCDEALEILSDIGADVSNAGRVRIPPRLVERALQSAPRSITMYDRSGQVAFTLDGASPTQFGGSIGGPNYADPFTGQSRPCYVQDIEDMARLVDALENISWIMTCPSHPTVPGELGDLMSLLHIMLNTSKPIGLTVNSLWGLEEMVHACSLVAGGNEALRQKPFILGSSEPVTPLSQERLAVQTSLFCAEK
jgi:trimethylamine--corrinoid protein Co-methyltransferase